MMVIAQISPLPLWAQLQRHQATQRNHILPHHKQPPTPATIPPTNQQLQTIHSATNQCLHINLPPLLPSMAE